MTGLQRFLGRETHSFIPLSPRASFSRTPFRGWGGSSPASCARHMRAPEKTHLPTPIAQYWKTRRPPTAGQRYAFLVGRLLLLPEVVVAPHVRADLASAVLQP